MDIVRGRKRNLPHKRSKKGCLSCRKRRKKCPEDYQQWSDGSWACSACEVRGQKCNLPLSKKGRQQQQQQQSTNIITSQSPSQLDHVQQQNVSSSLLEDASNIVYGTEHSVSLNRPSDAVISESKQTPFSTHLANNDTSFYHRQSVSTETSAGEPDKNAWLDTFLEEFMALTEPSLQTIVQPTLTPISSSSPALDLLSIAKSPKSNTRNEQNRPESVMDRMIRSDDLDDLLTKSAHIYDTFLCAIIDTSKIAGNASLIDHLMDITKSNNVCKASMVSCCLAYKDVIDRERQSPRGPSRFVQYLIKGSRKAPTISTIPSRQVHQWLKYATDGFHQSKLTMNLAAKLLTLLNLRFACICFSGARDAFALANDIHSVLCQLRVDVHYLRSTARKGTPLSVIIQALAFANIMDAATMKGVRPAILNESREMASALEVDLAVNPRADLKMVTVLSVELVDCIKRISDLSVDIAEGQLHHRSEIESKGEEIKQLIMVSFKREPMGTYNNSHLLLFSSVLFSFFFKTAKRRRYAK